MIPIWSLHLAATSSLTSELWERGEHPSEVMILLLTPPSTNSGRSSERFFYKNKVSFDERSSPLHLEHASKEARRTPIRHTSQWWYHTIDPLFWGRGRSSESSASSATSRRKCPSYYPPVACRKKGDSKHEATMFDQNEDSMTSKIAVKLYPPP